jgi:hypothetical protein
MEAAKRLKDSDGSLDLHAYVEVRPISGFRVQGSGF